MTLTTIGRCGDCAHFDGSVTERRTDKGTFYLCRRLRCLCCQTDTPNPSAGSLGGGNFYVRPSFGCTEFTPVIRPGRLR